MMLNAWYCLFFCRDVQKQTALVKNESLNPILSGVILFSFLNKLICSSSYLFLYIN